MGVELLSYELQFRRRMWTFWRRSCILFFRKIIALLWLTPSRLAPLASEKLRQRQKASVRTVADGDELANSRPPMDSNESLVCVESPRLFFLGQKSEMEKKISQPPWATKIRNPRVQSSFLATNSVMYWNVVNAEVSPLPSLHKTEFTQTQYFAYRILIKSKIL